MRAAFALRIVSGIIIFNFGVQESLRTFLNPFFTGKEHSSQDGAKLLISVKKIQHTAPQCRASVGSGTANAVFSHDPPVKMEYRSVRRRSGIPKI